MRTQGAQIAPIRLVALLTTWSVKRGHQAIRTEGVRSTAGTWEESIWALNKVVHRSHLES